MKLVLRILMLLILIPVLHRIITTVLLLPFIFTPGFESSSRVLLATQIAAVIALLPVVYFVLKGVDNMSEGQKNSVSVGAFTVGIVGFLGGILVSDYYWPDNEQNILGGVIMGSIGFVLGAFGGSLYWMLKKKA